MIKRSDNTIDSDPKKTTPVKPEINTTDSDATKNIDKKSTSSTPVSTPKKIVKTKVKEKEKVKITAPVSNPIKTIAVKMEEDKLDSDAQKISEAKHHDPFSVLGRHIKNNQVQIKVYLPYAETVSFSDKGPALNRIPGSDFFEYFAKESELPQHYKLTWVDKNGYTHEGYDPYDFGTQFPEFDQHLFGEGKHWHIYQKMGGHLHSVDGIDGVLFTLWAPRPPASRAAKHRTAAAAPPHESSAPPPASAGGCGPTARALPHG